MNLSGDLTNSKSYNYHNASLYLIYFVYNIISNQQQKQWSILTNLYEYGVCVCIILLLVSFAAKIFCLFHIKYSNKYVVIYINLLITHGINIISPHRNTNNIKSLTMIRCTQRGVCSSRHLSAAFLSIS